jgi:hypothetical protein
VPTAFRDHLVLGYEIVKWDGDLGQPDGVPAAVPDDDRRGEGPGCCRRTTRRSGTALVRPGGLPRPGADPRHRSARRYAEAFFVDQTDLDLEG